MVSMNDQLVDSVEYLDIKSSKQGELIALKTKLEFHQSMKGTATLVLLKWIY